MPKESSHDGLFELLDSVISHDPGCRGVRQLRVSGDLRRAAQALMSALCSLSPTVLIATGFPIPHTDRSSDCASPSRPETDGPPGALALAQGLHTLGARPVVICDGATAAVLRRAIQPSLAGPSVVELIEFPATHGECAVPNSAVNEFVHKWIDVVAPVALVSIERVGPAKDGRYYTFRGIDITDFSAPLDLLFDRARALGCPTIGIGDGGNEIGMGKVWGRVARAIPNGPLIGCVTETDYLIAAGVSNWGAYGLLAALSIEAGAREGLVPTTAEAWRVLSSVVDAGAVDGVSGRCEPTVDGLQWQVHAQCLEQLRQVAATVDSPVESLGPAPADSRPASV